MISKWEQTTLGEILTLQRGMDLPIQSRKNGNVPIVASTGVVGYHSEAPVKGPGVIIGRSGSIGGGQYIETDFWPLNTTLWVKDFKGNNPRFCYYLLRSIDFSGLNAGSGVPTLNRNHLHPMPIICPLLEEQIEIASFLGAIDDRIKLLRETNTTLETIAQGLFKSWFVDFDPVRAKAEGLEPEGMDAATAALFPDSFEESNLGLLPKGWLIGELQDLLVLQRGFDLPASERIAGDYPLIAASGPSGTHHIAMAKGPGVVTGRSGVLGKVFLTLEDYWPLNTTLWVKKFNRATPCYAYELLKLLDFSSFNAGSAVPTLNRNHIHGLKYVLPPLELVQAYEDMARAIHLRVLENNRQIQTLTRLRDTLLPRLLSGQLRLPEVEASIENILSEAV